MGLTPARCPDAPGSCECSPGTGCRVSIDDSADCEDQALVPTEFCHAWPCQNVPLVKDRNGYWTCPKCSGNYGKDAKG